MATSTTTIGRQIKAWKNKTKLLTSRRVCLGRIPRIVVDVSDVPEIPCKQKERGRRAFCVSSSICIPSRRIFIHRLFSSQFSASRRDEARRDKDAKLRARRARTTKRAILATRIRSWTRIRVVFSCVSRRDELDRHGVRRKTDCFKLVAQSAPSTSPGASLQSN